VGLDGKMMRPWGPSSVKDGRGFDENSAHQFAAGGPSSAKQFAVRQLGRARASAV
jgi:hypothetical protein